MAKPKTIRNYINGTFYEPQSGEYLSSFNPATGELYMQVPDSGVEDVNLAVKAAQRAFQAWSSYSIEKRTRIMVRIADLIEQNLEVLALAESEDNGKPITLAQTVDIPRAAANFRFFGTAIRHFASESHSMGTLGINYTLRKPLGVVACISPWNLPLYLFTWKIAPALAAGNCVVAKPSEITPRTAYLLASICKEAGLPNGVLNIIHGSGQKTGQTLVEHPDIKAISFTGGTETGRAIAQTAAPQFKKLSLELGGKNPTIIFADCDFNKMMETVLRSSFSNQGQICLCGSRILIERSIYERFKTEFIARTYQMKVGDPLDKETEIGAVVSESHMNKVLYYINLAQEEGGIVINGGKQVKPKGRCTNGWFLEPTIIEGLPQDCRTNQEEIFGPVVTIAAFDTDEEVIHLANSVEYGLAASVWTENISRAHKVADQLESGIVWINTWMMRDLRTPFGGVKNSGVGREGGWEALRFFTEPKNVCIGF